MEVARVILNVATPSYVIPYVIDARLARATSSALK